MLHVLLIPTTGRPGAPACASRWSRDIETLMSHDRSPEAEQAARAVETRLFFDPHLLSEVAAAFGIRRHPAEPAVVLWG